MIESLVFKGFKNNDYIYLKILYNIYIINGYYYSYRKAERKGYCEFQI